MLGLSDIDEVWPRIEAVAHTAIDGDDLTAENIREECRAGRALCFASSDRALICTLVPNRIRNDLELVVLLAASVGPHGAYEEHLPEVDEICRDLGASRVVFYSRRRGWERKLGAGWSLRHVAYVREVRDEERREQDPRN